MTITPINSINNQPASHDNRRKTQEAVAVGAGATAGAARTTNVVTNLKKGEPVFKGAIEWLKKITTSLNKTNETSGRLISKFKQDMAEFSTDIMKHLEKFNGSKFLTRFVKSSAAKGISTIGGGILAFFVLITGINKAVNTGEIAIGNLKPDKDKFFAAA